MISRQEILQKADELQVNPSAIQRDYMFGWVLAGVYSESALRNDLVLKGGNSFRKAYFERARYSRDLDFASTAILDHEYIHTELDRICAYVSANSGVVFETARTQVQAKKNIDSAKRVHEARLYFQDFFGQSSHITISIRMDITELDEIHLPVQSRNLIHDYSDWEYVNGQIKCLKLEEMLAAKLKCLLQRRHSADLYDFVNATIVNPVIDVNRKEIVDTFLRMTIFGSSPGFVTDLLGNLPFQIIRGLWEKYIICPLHAVVQFDDAVQGFRSVVDALFGALPRRRGDFAFFPSEFRNPIMDAGHSMTLLKIVYDGRERMVEPYSLQYKTRRDGIAREYLYVYDQTGGRGSGPGIKSFVHQNIQGITTTDIKFEPRYEVELSKAGELSNEPYFHGTRRGWSVRQWRLPRMSRLRSTSRYVIECPVCGKKFYRKTNTTTLSPHKDKYGNKCFGRIGHRV